MWTCFIICDFHFRILKGESQSICYTRLVWLGWDPYTSPSVPPLPHHREGKPRPREAEKNGLGAELAGWKSQGLRKPALGAFHWLPQMLAAIPSIWERISCPTLIWISLSILLPHGFSSSGGRLPQARLGMKVVIQGEVQSFLSKAGRQWGEAR